MADTKFMNFAEVTPDSTDSVLVGNSSNGVRRAQLSNLRSAIGATAQNCGGIVEESLGTANGYVKFANGLIIQWGAKHRVDINANTVTPIDFPIPFSNTDWNISLQYCSSGSNYPVLNVSEKLTTGFSVKNSDYMYGHIEYIAIGN